MDARWAGFLLLALLLGMGFAGRLLLVAHPVRVGIILVMWLTGTLLGLATWNLVRLPPDTPVFWLLATRVLASALGGQDVARASEELHDCGLPASVR